MFNANFAAMTDAIEMFCAETLWVEVAAEGVADYAVECLADAEEVMAFVAEVAAETAIEGVVVYQCKGGNRKFCQVFAW